MNEFNIPLRPGHEGKNIFSSATVFFTFVSHKIQCIFVKDTYFWSWTVNGTKERRSIKILLKNKIFKNTLFLQGNLVTQQHVTH